MHRVRQFFGHLTARVDPVEQRRAEAELPSGAARRLFAEMPVADRRHAIDVAARLVENGHGDCELIAAALLHDAAKGHRMRLWHRVAGVMLDAVAPSLLRRMATNDERSWRYPLRLYIEHARLSADAALAAGCSPRTAAFIRGDVAPADRALLAALGRADSGS